MTKNTVVVLDTQKEDGLKVHTEETMYMFLIHELSTGQNHKIKIHSKSSECVMKFSTWE